MLLDQKGGEKRQGVQGEGREKGMMKTQNGSEGWISKEKALYCAPVLGLYKSPVYWISQASLKKKRKGWVKPFILLNRDIYQKMPTVSIIL